MPTTRREFCAAVSGLFSGVALVGCGPGERSEQQAGDPTKPLRFSAKVIGKCEGHTGAVTHVAISPDGKSVVSGPTNEPYIRFWTIPDGKEIRKIQYAELDARFPGILSLQISPDGKWLAAMVPIAQAHRLYLWEMATGKEVPHNIEFKVGLRLAFSPDGTRLAVCGQGVQVWEIKDWRRVLNLQYDRNEVERARAVTFAPDGKHLAAILEAATFGKDRVREDVRLVRVVNAATGKEVFAAWKNGSMSDLAFSADGRLLAIAGRDFEEEGNRVRTWDWASGQLISKTAVLEKSVFAVRFHPERPVLVTGDASGSIQAWDVSKGRFIAELREHQDQVKALVFTNDGNTLISASRDRTLLIWQVDCRRVPCPLP